VLPTHKREAPFYLFLDEALTRRPRHAIDANAYIALLYSAAALNHANQNADDSDNQENMDQAAHGVGCHQAKQPQDDQDNRDCV